MESAPRPRVGFIGLGYIGHGMARNILARGFPLTVMAHRKREAVDDLVSQGAREVTTPAEMALESDVVILCVTGAQEVNALVRGETGLASGAKPGLIIIDCTTSGPSTLLRLAADFSSRGLVFVDAPLGRSPKEAWQGALSVMVGCDERTLDRIRPVLASFATTVQHVGELGNGHRLKLVNNLISLGYAALYSEALVLARKAGLSVDAFDQLVRSSRMHCAFYDTFIGWALNGDPNTHRFAMSTALHTVSDIEDLSGSLGLRGRLAAAIGEIYRETVIRGFGQAMLPELPRSMAELDGIDLAPAHQLETT
jgi:3-hydroxyisobutyrate dehydrogenase-like beta-hydroxyacid dehydrogenase